MTNQKIGHTIILFIALFSFIETQSQVQNFTYTDCNGNTESIYGIISQGKPLLIASKGFDCSICMSQAPANQNFAAQNPNVRVWGAMNYRYSSATPTCTQVNNWKNTYSWNSIFMFPDVNDEWVASGFPTYYVISPIDSEIIYQGSSFSTATAQANSVITACNAPALSVNTIDAVCNGESGTATITATGGNPPYNYNWSNGETTTSITAAAGIYAVTVTDNSTCAAGETVVIGDPLELSVELESTIAQVNCAGSASVSVSGGTAPYTITWSNGSMTQTINNLCAGWYGITIVDANNCLKSDSIAVSATTGIFDAQDSQEFSIYPNPVNDEIFLESSLLDSNNQITIQIFNTLGESVFHTGNFLSETSINISKLPAGTYYLQIRGAKNIKAQKFVKE